MDQKMDDKIFFAHQILRWDEGIALGNGQMGCLIWGKPSHLRFSLDRTDIWDDSVPPGTEEETFTYQNLVRLAKEKNIEQIREIFDRPYQHPTPTKLPAGKIILTMPQYADIGSQLDLYQAQAILHPVKEDDAETEEVRAADAEIKSVVHARLPIGMISVNLPIQQFSIELKAPAFGKKTVRLSGCDAADAEAVSKGTLRDIQYEAPVQERIRLENGSYLEYFRQKINTGPSYGVVMGVKVLNQNTEIYYRIVTTQDRPDAFEDAVFEIKGYLSSSYNQLLPSHTQWWEEYWAQSSISLPDKEMERNWYLANYLLASCSRRGFAPMPLQGVWTADEDTLPPWKGDYHNDLNTQMSYYSYLKANHIQQGASFVDFLWERREQAAAFARSFYGTKGICLPAVMTIQGQPLGGWPMYSLSPTNQIWLCRAFDDYYRYTGDESFLRERLYPYFKETAECIGALLEKGPDGLWYLPISSSPEIHDDRAEAFLKPNSNYDLSLLKYLYETLEHYAIQLAGADDRADRDAATADPVDDRADRDAAGAGRPEDASVWKWDAEIQRWQEMQRNLPPLAVDERGVLMLAEDEILAESHRHFSHAHAIHPLRLIRYDTEENRRMIHAVIQDLEQLGSSMWVGFSFCWMAELYAVAHKGEQAAEMLRIFWDAFCSPNGFHLNGDYKKKGYSSFHYRPFTLEANMCAADALQEMLLYTQTGEIEPFPAIPVEWMTGPVSFDRLRAESGILVSAALVDGKLQKLILEAPCACGIKIRGWDRQGEPDADAVWECCLERGKNNLIACEKETQQCNG